jgi:hypothetical protein
LRWDNGTAGVNCCCLGGGTSCGSCNETSVDAGWWGTGGACGTGSTFSVIRHTDSYYQYCTIDSGGFTHTYELTINLS